MSRSRKFNSLTVLVLFALLLGTAVSCSSNQELVGSWVITETDDSAFAAGMIFEFREDKSLLITTGYADLDPEEKESFDAAYRDVSLTYRSSPDGTLNITMSIPQKGSLLIRMSYELTGDRLAVTDEDGLTLIFSRQ